MPVDPRGPLVEHQGWVRHRPELYHTASEYLSLQWQLSVHERLCLMFLSIQLMWLPMCKTITAVQVNPHNSTCAKSWKFCRANEFVKLWISIAWLIYYLMEFYGPTEFVELLNLSCFESSGCEGQTVLVFIFKEVLLLTFFEFEKFC